MEQRDRNGLTEKEFLEAYAKKNYPRPYVTADLVVFTEGEPEVLLVRRKGHPYIGRWAFPGGFAEPNESVPETALRELREETGIEALSEADIREVGLFSRPGRDPRGWIVSSVYTATVRKESVIPKAGDDAADAQWFSVCSGQDGVPVLSSGAVRLAPSDLAFDHGEILIKALGIRFGGQN